MTKHQKSAFLARLTGFILMFGLAMVAAAQTLTAEQVQRFEQLTPAQQARVMEVIGQDIPKQVDEPALEQPQLVLPLPVEPGHAPEEEDENAVTESAETEADKSREPLKPFGYDLFTGVPTTFAPATDIPIDVDYVLGPGDTVKIQLFGKEHAEYSLVVSREGRLHFPKLGPIPVAGLTFREMQDVVKTQIEKQMIGEKAVITLGALRSIRVFILGDVNQPGSYTVSALSTMTNALFVSGGVSEVGSLRKIQLKRRGKVVAHLDLYDLLLQGDTGNDVRLQPGDVIFVPPLGQTVGVAGEVRRPAIYELKHERNLQQLLELSGGLLPTAYPQASQIERINSRGERTLVDVDLSDKSVLSTRIQSGDTLHVFSILEKMENIVVLSGHVHRPGGYQWRKGMRLSDLIHSIRDDLLPRPDLDYALVRRELMPDQRIEVFSVHLGQALQHPQSQDNVVLQSRDEVIVFGASEDRREIVDPLVEQLRLQASFRQPARTVHIGGVVRHPGDYPLETGMKVSDLIRAGGGLSEAAYALGAELTRYAVVDGSYREIAHVNVDLASILKNEGDADIDLLPHDVLNIKRLPEWATAETVEIHGEVRFPGIYPIARGEQLSKVLQRAGGVTDMAFPQGAVFLREELRKREKQRIDEMSRRLESDLASVSLKLAQEKGGNAGSLDIIRELGDQLRSVRPIGRLVINLPKLIEETRQGRRSDYDVTLADGDKLYVPPVTQEVTVTGEVFYPTSHLYAKGLDRDRYINMSGGATGKADTSRTYVIRADGSVETGGNWYQDFNGGGVKPGDTIVVPLDVERVRPITLWTNVSQIIYQLAITAASANAIGVF
ncbi:protein involved in polysaccharide export with SLBB domain [Thiogranum longum]|uniref:Protein involved in polysaccharide export with SLBB domain n=1 Tax=Thiogranum longum TaxID=1537524 RepID=A0A4R1H8E8_9GAMM|nr:SLBB domain-containing protein [Thiogranum longum]TCK18114.1 protein involved in polysaccharide export with SLBB domain [Thiogranum longum]